MASTNWDLRTTDVYKPDYREAKPQVHIISHTNSRDNELVPEEQTTQA